jgi:hypothetical protein
MAKRFPEDFNDLMETFKHSEDVLHDISAISRLTVSEGAATKKVFRKNFKSEEGVNVNILKVGANYLYLIY